ncbi:hypothetical protein DFH06DRAFT_1316292 [Mycena polygramma]|nr:hypothetical protein DFH06DRAFT_1316292 [Mycena polygramma]
MAETLFPSSALQAFTAAINLLGITILTVFFSRRLLGDGLTTRQAWSRLTWARGCILLVFLDSYLFLFSAAMLMFGVGLQMNKTACAAGIYLCVLFYSSSKVLIYAFLTEKVYIVWDTTRPRLRSPVYLVCLGTVLLYAVVIIIMLIGRVDEFRPGDRACVIGLKPIASIPLLTYDLYINVLLTTLFLWPLLRSRHSSARLRSVATRTLVASGAALTTSTINITVLTIMKGHQLGWICLSSCGADMIFNAAALFWVTIGAQQPTLSGSSANRQLSDVPANTMVPPPSPARSTFKQEIKSSNMFKMGPLSPNPTKEFQIHVTTQSHVSRSPPSGPSLSNLSETESDTKMVIIDESGPRSSN